MNAPSKIEQLKSLASYQWSLFSSAQAEGIGLQRSQIARLTKNGTVERIRRGVYAFDYSDGDPNADIKAAWMSLYPKRTASERLSNPDYDAIVVGRTAATLHKIGDFYSSPFSFAVKKRRQTRQDDIVCHVWETDPSDVVIVDSLPVTSLEKTIADLIRLNEDASLVGNALNDAIKLGNGFDYDRFIELLNPLASKNGFKKSDGESFAYQLFSRYISPDMEKQFLSIAEDIIRFNTSNISDSLNDVAQNAFSNVRTISKYDTIKQYVSNIAKLSTNPTPSIDLTSTVKAAQKLAFIAKNVERETDDI